MSGQLEELNKNIKTLISALDAFSTSGILAKSDAGSAAEDDDDLLSDDEPAKATEKAKAASAPKKVTHDDISAKVQPLTQDVDTKAKVREIMTKFNVKRLADLKEEQYKAFWLELDKLEKGEAEDSSGDDDDDFI